MSLVHLLLLTPLSVVAVSGGRRPELTAINCTKFLCVFNFISRVQNSNILKPIRISIMPPKNSALLSNHVPLLAPTNTPNKLKKNVVTPIVAQAMNGFTSISVSVNPAAIASILVAIANMSSILCVTRAISSSIPSVIAVSYTHLTLPTTPYV